MKTWMDDAFQAYTEKNSEARWRWREAIFLLALFASVAIVFTNLLKGFDAPYYAYLLGFLLFAAAVYGGGSYFWHTKKPQSNLFCAFTQLYVILFGVSLLIVAVSLMVVAFLLYSMLVT